MQGLDGNLLDAGCIGSGMLSVALYLRLPRLQRFPLFLSQDGVIPPFGTIPHSPASYPFQRDRPVPRQAVQSLQTDG